MDGLSAHKHSDVTNLINSIGNLDVIFLPPHSSHFLQPLDLCIFLKHKILYSNALVQYRRSNGNLKGQKVFSDKIVRIIDTWEAVQTHFITTSWERASILVKLIRNPTLSFQFVLNYSGIKNAIMENCKNGESYVMNNEAQFSENATAQSATMTRETISQGQ